MIVGADGSWGPTLYGRQQVPHPCSRGSSADSARQLLHSYLQPPSSQICCKVRDSLATSAQRGKPLSWMAVASFRSSCCSTRSDDLTSPLWMGPGATLKHVISVYLLRAQLIPPVSCRRYIIEILSSLNFLTPRL